MKVAHALVLVLVLCSGCSGFLDGSETADATETRTMTPSERFAVVDEYNGSFRVTLRSGEATLNQTYAATHSGTLEYPEFVSNALGPVDASVRLANGNRFSTRIYPYEGYRVRLTANGTIESSLTEL